MIPILDEKDLGELLDGHDFFLQALIEPVEIDVFERVIHDGYQIDVKNEGKDSRELFMLPADIMRGQMTTDGQAYVKVVLYQRRVKLSNADFFNAR